MIHDATGRLYTLFAELLTYPGPTTAQQAESSLPLLQASHPEAAAALERFLIGLEQLPPERFKELYTITFDLQPVCYPYVGYQLFGESYKRGSFMAQLNEAYHAFGYSVEQELPDHLPAVLRFLGLDAANRAGQFCQVLLTSGVTPTLDKMLRSFGTSSENPYFWLLSALQRFVSAQTVSETLPGVA